MCGIVGYIGKENAIDMLINGLKTLEYRGYDSSGIAYAQNSQVKIIKSVGRVNDLEQIIPSNLYSNIGIGHTRWATHGVPNEINAHPHKVGITTIVHNGIIENYIELKKDLAKHYRFKSETDTEVACALIDFCYQQEKDKLKALRKAKEKLHGSYAFAIIFDDEINTIYAIRKNSPLILAKKDNNQYLASDIVAILKYTNEYYLLEQNEYAKLTSDDILFYNENFKVINKNKNTYQGTCEDVMLNGFQHFMLKEIHEEDTVYEKIIHDYIPHLNIKELEKRLTYLKKYNHITIIGCGSAYHVGMVSKNFFEEYANIPTDVILASEYRYKKIFSNKKELVILISQSGETADTLEALRKAKENNMDTLGIVNVFSSSIARESKKVIYTLAGCEIAVATTKAYLAQVLILSLITITMSYQRKNITMQNANKYLHSLNDLISETKNILQNKDIYYNIAKKIYQNNVMFFIGRGIDYALCMEASLKMKEISYIHSEAYPAGELKHGTISLIDNDTIVIGIVTDKNIASKTISNLKETKARGAKIILVTTNNLIEELEKDIFYEELIIINNINPIFNSLLVMSTLQLLSYYVALEKGENIDKPKNLAKSVTVE